MSPIHQPLPDDDPFKQFLEPKPDPNAPLRPLSREAQELLDTYNEGQRARHPVPPTVDQRYAKINNLFAGRALMINGPTICWTSDWVPQTPITESEWYDLQAVMSGLRDVPWCNIHHRPEPTLEGDYQVCGECWHVWRSEAELRHDVEQSDPRGYAPTDLSFVYTCPLCAHDL